MQSNSARMSGHHPTRLHQFHLASSAPPVITLADSDGKEEEDVAPEEHFGNNEIEVLGATVTHKSKKSGGGGSGGNNLVRRRGRKRRFHTVNTEEAALPNNLAATLPPNFHLKEILLSQLDLIKQQSEDIVKKNQRLRDLQKENEKLKQRLIEVTTNAPAPTTKFCLGSTMVKDAMFMPPPPPARRPSSCERPAAETTHLKTDCKEELPTLKEEPLEEKELSTTSETFLTCGQPFFVQQGEYFIARERQEIALILAQSEVPGWRVHQLTSIYSMEGTENIEDITMLKRHAKQELDEKRRKRWDSQRLREQRNLQKLRARYAAEDVWVVGKVGRKGSNEFAPRSLMPDPLTMLKDIEMTQMLPVTVFGGYQLPALAETSFALPWLTQQTPVGKKRRRSSLKSAALTIDSEAAAT